MNISDRFYLDSLSGVVFPKRQEASDAPLTESANDDTDLGDPGERAALIAEILAATHGDTALEAFSDDAEVTESLATLRRHEGFATLLEGWDSLKHPRGKGGRFIPKGSQEAVTAAHEQVKKALGGAKTATSAKELADHLSILTVKQLHELKKAHGLTASGRTVDELRQRIAERLDKGRRGEDAPATGGDYPSHADWAKGEREKNKADREAKQQAQAAAAAPPWQGGTPEQAKVYNAPTAELHVDPKRFQFKLNVSGSHGVTDEFREVKTFNPDFAGVISVWKDPEDGRTYVINGHHRHELAERTGHPDLAVRYITAGNAKEARAVGALVNIAEGRGTAVDAAKFMRDMGVSPDDLQKHGVSLKGKVAADAATLVNLNDRLFDRLARGTFSEEKALAIAKHLADPEMQNQLVRLLDKREDEGKDLSSKVIEEMAKEMAETPKYTKKEEGGLFGDIESDESLFVQRNEIKSHVRGELAREVADFAAVAVKRRAANVAAAGNVLDTDKNKEIAVEANRVKNAFDLLVNRKGIISDAVNGAAEKYAKAKTKKERDAIRKEAVDGVRDAIFRDVGVSAGRKGQSDSSSPVSGAGQPAGAAGAAGDDAGRGDVEQHGLTGASSAKPATAETQPTTLWGEPLAQVERREAVSQAMADLAAKREQGRFRPGADTTGDLWAQGDYGTLKDPLFDVPQSSDESPPTPEPTTEPEKQADAEAKAGTGDNHKRVGKDGTEYVRAPAGGAVSEVNGQHYKGGHWMPIHGLTPKQEKKPATGASTATPPVPNEDKEAPGSRRPPRGPMTPEQIAAEKERREQDAKWKEVGAGPLGRMKWFGEKPNSKALGSSITNLKDWKEYASEIGEDKLKALVPKLEAMVHGRIDAEDEASFQKTGQRVPQDNIDYAKNLPKQSAEEDANYVHGSKKHLKETPSSYYARHLVQHALEAGDIDTFHKVHQLLADAQATPAPSPAPAPPAPPGDAPAPASPAAPQGQASGQAKEPQTRAEAIAAEIAKLRVEYPDNDDETYQAQAEMNTADWKPPPEKGKYEVGQTVSAGGKTGSYRGTFTHEDGKKYAVIATGRGQFSAPVGQVEHAGFEVTGTGETPAAPRAPAPTPAQSRKAAKDAESKKRVDEKRSGEVARANLHTKTLADHLGDEELDDKTKSVLSDQHRQAVEAALAAGKPVPPEVLADYPDLQAKATPASAPLSATIASAVAAKAAGNPHAAVTGTHNLRELFDEVKANHPSLTIPQLHDELKRLHDSGTIRLHPAPRGETVDRMGREHVLHQHGETWGHVGPVAAATSPQAAGHASHTDHLKSLLAKSLDPGAVSAADMDVAVSNLAHLDAAVLQSVAKEIGVSNPGKSKVAILQKIKDKLGEADRARMSIQA